MTKITARAALKAGFASLAVAAWRRRRWMPDVTICEKDIDSVIFGAAKEAGCVDCDAIARMRDAAQNWQPGDSASEQAYSEAFDALLAKCDPEKLAQEIDV